MQKNPLYRSSRSKVPHCAPGEALVWDYGYGVLAAVLAAERAVPTAEDLIAELPVFVPPVV